MNDLNSSEPDPHGRLSASEATEVAAHLAELTKAGLPLSDGLRALADESGGGRLGSALYCLADRLDAGVELGAALDEQSEALPPHLRALLASSLRTGRLPEALEEFVDMQRARAELRRRIWLAVAYPLLLLAMLVGLMFLTKFVILDVFASVFREFDATLPELTNLVLRVWSPLTWCGAALLAAIVATPFLVLFAAHCSWPWSIIYRIPFFGPMLRFQHLSEFARLMGLLLEQQIPMPVALRLCADGLSGRRLADHCLAVADEVERGRAVNESLAERSAFPPSLAAVLHWGQHASALPEAFRRVAEMYSMRTQPQAAILEAILLPTMFLIIVASVGTTIVALALPLLSLFQTLS